MTTDTSEFTENFQASGLLARRVLSIDPTYAESHDRHILVVDDEECVRQLFADYLNQSYSCETAVDAQQALEMISCRPFALVISDVQMPGLSGIELLRKINEYSPDTAVIMVSGIDRTQRVIDAIRMGASDYLLKPCELNVLTASVERALERRALLRNARRYKQDLEHRNAELARQKTEMERLQAQVMHTEKMASLGQLAAGVAHEINNPAGFILSNIQLLGEHLTGLRHCLEYYDDVPMPTEAAAGIAALKKETGYHHLVADVDSILSDCYAGAERIRDVVLNLRLFSRLDEAAFKRVDLNEGIDSTVRLLSGYYKSGRINLTQRYGDIPPVNCYAAQINQVWMNLLVNAAQAIGDESGEVTLETEYDGQSVLVSISDTGRGMDREELSKIFDPFFTTKPVGEGTGLGLSISHGIVERHGGSINVESTPGKGTTFIISLPVDPPRTLPESENGKV